MHASRPALRGVLPGHPAGRKKLLCHPSRGTRLRTPGPRGPLGCRFTQGEAQWGSELVCPGTCWYPRRWAHGMLSTALTLGQGPSHLSHPGPWRLALGRPSCPACDFPEENDKPQLCLTPILRLFPVFTAFATLYFLLASFMENKPIPAKFNIFSGNSSDDVFNEASDRPSAMMLKQHTKVCTNQHGNKARTAGCLKRKKQPQSNKCSESPR